MKPLEEMIEISRYAGMREDLAQAGGGNSSIKLDGETMLLKASGYQLCEVTQDSGYAVVNYKVIADYFLSHAVRQIGRDEEQEILKRAYISGPRPSIEMFLHAITDRCTLHTHPVLVNVLAARHGGMEELQELFPDAVFVGYATPGIQLAKKYFTACKDKQEGRNQLPDTIFLENHGLVISGSNSAQVIQKTERTILKLARYLKSEQDVYSDATAIYRTVSSMGPYQDKVVYLTHNRYIYMLLEKNGYNVWDFGFVPDCFVYCGRSMLRLTRENMREELMNYKSDYGLPTVILYQKGVYIIADSINKAREIESVLSFSAQVCYANSGKVMKLLPSEEADFLLDWESEKYRKNRKQEASAE